MSGSSFASIADALERFKNTNIDTTFQSNTIIRTGVYISHDGKLALTVSEKGSETLSQLGLIGTKTVSKRVINGGSVSAKYSLQVPSQALFDACFKVASMAAALGRRISISTRKGEVVECQLYVE